MLPKTDAVESRSPQRNFASIFLAIQRDDFSSGHKESHSANNPRPTANPLHANGTSISILTICTSSTIARLGLRNLQRSRKDMPSRPAILHLAVDVGVVGGNVCRRNPLLTSRSVDRRWTESGSAPYRRNAPSAPAWLSPSSIPTPRSWGEAGSVAAGAWPTASAVVRSVSAKARRILIIGSGEERSQHVTRV